MNSFEGTDHHRIPDVLWFFLLSGNFGPLDLLFLFLFRSGFYIPDGNLALTWWVLFFLTSLSPRLFNFSSPKTGGKGGGLASVFKLHFCCLQLSLVLYSSFEVKLLEFNSSPSVLWCPPKCNKDFNQDFAHLLGSLLLKCVLIVGDFGIHVCCESGSLVKDYFALIDSLDLSGWLIQLKEKDRLTVWCCHMVVTSQSLKSRTSSWDIKPFSCYVQLCKQGLNSERPVWRLHTLNHSFTFPPLLPTLSLWSQPLCWSTHWRARASVIVQQESGRRTNLGIMCDYFSEYQRTLKAAKSAFPSNLIFKDSPKFSLVFFLNSY